VPTVAEPELPQFRISEHYKPFPKQIKFHRSGARFRLCIGSFGSAKSTGLLWEAFIHGLEYPGSNSLILRKTIPDLKRTVIDKFLSTIPREAYESYNATDHIVYFHPQPCIHGVLAKQPCEKCPGGRATGGAQSKLYLSACERDADVGKFLSTEYVFIGFEELGEFSFAIWDALEGRNRCSVPGSRACMVGVTNPMGPGYSWIKKLWIDGLCEHKVKRGEFCQDCGTLARIDAKKTIKLLGIDPEKYNQDDYEYIHSTVDDNPVYANNKEYIATLEKSPNRDRIRWGRLDVRSGDYFENFDPSRHMRFKQEFIFQAWQPFWVGWDYGFGHYACINFMTKALFKDPARRIVRMVNVTVRELVLQKNTPKEQAEALIMAIPRLPEEQGGGYAWNVEQIHFSWERFMKTQGDFTIADEVGDVLAAAGLPRPTRSNTDRIAGWQKMFDLLDSDEWFIIGGDDGCPTLLESIPLLQRGNGIDASIEDVVKPKGISLPDDMGDAARYAIAGALLEEEDVPESVRIQERLAAIKDPMAKFMAGYKIHNEQKRRETVGVKPPSLPTWASKLRGNHK
jgi:phage terminase large subunit